MLFEGVPCETSRMDRSGVGSYQDAYSLKKIIPSNEVVYILAPGPSIEGLDVSRVGPVRIIVNSAIEYPSILDARFAYWFYADKRFSWLYSRLLSRSKLNVVVPDHQAGPLRRKYPHLDIFWYQYQMKLKRRVPMADPFWVCEERSYFPGRCSSVVNAISLAEFLSPSIVILIGVDFDIDEGSYYGFHVESNPGPKIENRERSLTSGLAWFRRGLEILWPRSWIFTTSRALCEKTNVMQIELEEAYSLHERLCKDSRLQGISGFKARCRERGHRTPPGFDKKADPRKEA